MRLLVVEDNADGREALCELLELWDYQVSAAEDGWQALQVAFENPPHVALVDIGLPQLDGYQVARRLRERFGDRVFLIAMTGYGQPEDRRRAFEAGFDLHLVKPVDLGKLHHLLQDLDRR